MKFCRTHGILSACGCPMCEHEKKNKAKTAKVTDWNVLDYIKTQADILQYLEAAMDEDDREFFLTALEDVKTAIIQNKIKFGDSDVDRGEDCCK